MPDHIPDDVRVFRCVKDEDVIVQDDGKVRPKSSVFSDHRDDGAMSVYLEDEIIAAGKKPEDLLTLWPGYRLCYLTAGEYRQLNQRIVRAHDDAFPGHANVTDGAGKRSGGRRTKLAQKARWLET
jgi:hypothetical protein